MSASVLGRDGPVYRTMRQSFRYASNKTRMTSKRLSVDQRQAHHVRQRRQRGFTLIELIIFIVVVAAGLAGILSVMNTVVKSSADPMIRKQTIAIAESLLEEILLKDYASPSGGTNGVTTCTMAPLVGDVRAPWDNICDYNGYTHTGIVDILGVATGGLEKYDISAVTVGATTDLTGVAAKKVTVQVRGPQGDVSLTGYRSCDLSPSCPLP